MSEKPQFERPPVRVVGKSSEKTKEELKEKIAARFGNDNVADFSNSILEKFKRLEYAKRPYEVEFIASANEVINRLREKYGLQPFQVSPDKVHIVPPELLEEAGYGTGFVGLQDTNRQLIVANAGLLRQNTTKTGRNILHEITHLMGYVAFEAVEEEETKDEKAENGRTEDAESDASDIAKKKRLSTGFGVITEWA